MFCQFTAKSKQLKKQLMIEQQETELPSSHLLHATDILYSVLALKIVGVWTNAKGATQLWWS